MKYLNDVKAKYIKSAIENDTIYHSKNSGCFTITRYLDSYNIVIKFVNTGYETVAQLGSIKSGNVKDLYSPSVYGVGVCQVLNTHLRSVVLKQKNIRCGVVC